MSQRSASPWRHLRGDLYEVRVSTDSRDFRVLFAQEAKFVLLSLSAFKKRTQKTHSPRLSWPWRAWLIGVSEDVGHPSFGAIALTLYH